MVIGIAVKRFFLWLAVDDEGEVLDMLLQGQRDERAALKLMRKLLKQQGFAPAVVCNTYNVQRHLISRSLLRTFRDEAMTHW